MNYEVFGNRVMVDKVEDKEQKTPAGLIIPMANENNTWYGTVVSRGVEVKYAKVGDIVFFNRVSSFPVVLNKKTYYLLEEVHVLVKRV